MLKMLTVRERHCSVGINQRIYLVFVALLLCTTTNFALAKADRITPSEKLIRTEFDRSKSGRALSVRQQGEILRAEVCFDQCDYFQWKISSSSAAVWDFIVLFEYKLGFASDLDEFKAAADRVVPAALKRFSKRCKLKSGSPTDFDCVWSKLAHDHSIKVGLADYDEGERCFAWRDLVSLAPPKKSKCSPITVSPWK